jgi:hypothetical protein
MYAVCVSFNNFKIADEVLWNLHSTDTLFLLNSNISAQKSSELQNVTQDLRIAGFWFDAI